MSSRLRSALVLLVGGTVIALVPGVRGRVTEFLVARDFLEYWAAGRVNLRGGNPYHPDELLREQQTVDPAREEAVMMWNPPPALALYTPFGLPPARQAALLWVAGQFAAVFVGCRLLWRVYCPTADGFAALVGLSCAGVWWLIAYGQNTGFLVLGLAGFLHFTQRDRPVSAGACAALTALKPHLLAVFGVLLIANACTRRGRLPLLAGTGAVALALGAALAANPHVVGQFVDAVRHPTPGATPLSEWELPAAAFWLRVWLAPRHFWVQFVPCAVACAAFLVYRLRAGAAWDWARALPLVVSISVLVTPYGGWIFDLPVLLVPAVWAAARLVCAGRLARAVTFVLAQSAVTLGTFATPRTLDEYWWVAPAMLAPCLLAVGRGARS